MNQLLALEEEIGIIIPDVEGKQRAGMFVSIIFMTEILLIFLNMDHFRV